MVAAFFANFRLLRKTGLERLSCPKLALKGFGQLCCSSQRLGNTRPGANPLKQLETCKKVVAVLDHQNPIWLYNKNQEVHINLKIKDGTNEAL